MKPTLYLLSVLLFSISAQSQDTLSISGGDASGAGGTSSYTLGQVFYSANSSDNGSVSQGVQQSFELFTLSNPQLTTINVDAVVYPNPSSDYIMLNIIDNELTGLSYVLTDIQGKVVSNEKINSIHTQLSLERLSVGTYVLKINQNNSELKTFKIIKK